MSGAQTSHQRGRETEGRAISAGPGIFARLWCLLRGRHDFHTHDQLEHFWDCQTCGKRNYVPNTR